MYRRCILILGILLAVFSPCAYSANETLSMTKFDNGLKVIVREGHSVNLVAVDIWVKAGSINEDSSNNGVSHLVEHMVFKATKKFGNGDIDREMEGIGAEVNGGTSKDYVHFFTTVASEYLQTALDVLADAVMNAQFRPEDIEKERLVVLDEIARSESDPVKVAVNAFARTSYTRHPYGMPETGTRESVLKLKRDNLASYYAKYFTPTNTCVSIAGDVTKQDAVTAVVKSFSGFERIHPNSVVKTSLPANEPARTTPLLRRYTWKQSKKAYLVIGLDAAPVSEAKDVCALDTIAAMLGNTSRGRISAALTDAHIAFTEVNADYVTQRCPGLIYVLVSIDPADEEKAASVILTEYRRLANEQVTAGELSESVSRVVGADLYQDETFSGQARVMGLWETIDSYDHYLGRSSILNSLSVSDVTDCAKKYLSGDNYCLITLEPENTSKTTESKGK